MDGSTTGAGLGPALNALKEGDDVDDAWLVIVDTIPSPTPADRRSRLTALAERCGLKIDWMGS